MTGASGPRSGGTVVPLTAVVLLPTAQRFIKPHADVPKNIDRIHAETPVPIKDSVHGFVYKVANGALREVVCIKSTAGRSLDLDQPGRLSSVSEHLAEVGCCHTSPA